MIKQGSPKRARGRVEILDAARLVAALMVVFFHWYYNGILNGKVTSIEHVPAIAKFAQFGYWGVTFFFLISGFVIARSVENKTPGEFLAARATRLFPLFWAALAITSSVALVQQQPKMMVSVNQILVNITMVPTLFGVDPVDGAYWTLAYEWLFYLTMFALIVVSRGEPSRNIEKLAIGWILLIAAGFFLPPFHLWNYNCAAFLAGVMAGRSSKYGWSILRVAIFVVASVLLIVGELDNAAWRMGLKERALAGVIIVGFLALIVAATFSTVASWKIPLSSWAGRMTYPAYLLHAHLGYMSLNNWATPQNQVWFPLAMFVVLIFSAWGLERLVDGVFGPMWKRVFQRAIKVPVDAVFTKSSAKK